MRKHEEYPTDVTDEEAKLGFQCLLVENPRQVFAGNAPLMPVVARIVGPFDYIFKVKDPDGKIEYSHRQYGSTGKGGPFEKPAWNPVLTTCPSAAMAIELAQTGRDEKVANSQGLSIDPEFPSLELKCQKCRRKFSIQKNHFLPDEPITCPCGDVQTAQTYA